MIELGEKPKKKIDYLKEMREEKKDHNKYKTNKGGWRKIIVS